MEEKEQYDLGKGGAAGGSYFGYKGYGMAVVDRKGTADRNEFYNVRLYISFLFLRTLH